MKVCLINSSCRLIRDMFYLPLGLLSLGAVLEKNGYTVKMVDLAELVRQKKLEIDRNFHRNAAKIIISRNIDILGFNTRCDTYPNVLNIAKKCKELNPSCVIIFGGPQATLLDKETLQNFRFVDIIVRGEGELTIIELMNKLKDKKELRDVAGVTYRGLRNDIIRNQDRKLIEDLDSLPQMAYHLLDEYSNKGNIFRDRWISMEAGRGCPYNCIFCSTSLVHKRVYRLRRPERIVKEMEFLKNKYGIKYFSLQHDHLLFDRERIIKLCGILIQRKLNIYWNCSSRPDYVSPELLKIMVRSGCDGIYLGIESGSQRIQKSIQKNIDVSTVPNIIEECEKYNMLITVSFIIGFPDEREEDINATLKLALVCSLFTNCVIQLHLLGPMPRTPLFEKYKDRLIFTGLFSDIADAQISRLKDNSELIKKYPSIFSTYYGIKPKYASIYLFHNMVNIFLILFSIYRLSLKIVIKELKFKPTELFEKLYKKISKGNRRRSFIISKLKIKKLFPQTVDCIYKERKADPNFIKSIIKFEIKKFNEYKQRLIKGEQKQLIDGIGR